MTRINLTDPDAPIMKGKKGDFNTNYNTQLVCNDNQIISFCDVVVIGNDKTQLIPSIEGAISNTEKNIAIVLADADYGSYASLEFLEEKNILGYVPYKNMNAKYDEDKYHSSHFVFDKSKNVYTCPAGQILEQYRSRKDANRKHHFDQYRTNACKECPFQKQCVKPKRARRVIEREKRQYLKDEMKIRLNSKEGKLMYQKRLHPIEAIFGHLKYNLGYNQFLLRGLKKVKAEFTIMCLTYNLRKLVTYLSSFFVNLQYGLTLSRPPKRRKIYYPQFVKELLLNTLIKPTCLYI